MPTVVTSLVMSELIAQQVVVTSLVDDELIVVQAVVTSLVDEGAGRSGNYGQLTSG